jgi:hypothetical protein
MVYGYGKGIYMVHLYYTSTYRAHICSKLAVIVVEWVEILTMLSPNTILHQNRTLFNSVRPLIHLLRCTMTMGICSIMAKKP